MSLINLLEISSLPCVITLVGAGGKTSLMFELANDFNLSGRKTITTTTTKIFVPTPNQAASVKLTRNEGWLESAAIELAACGNVCIGKSIDTASNKLLGINDDEVFLASRIADITIVEGDGACGFSVKGTEAWEPRIPCFTDIVIYVMGLDCIGKPANELTVHKPSKFLKVTSLNENDNISPASLAILGTHPDAGQKNVPAGSLFYVLLNKSDTLENIKQAHELGLMVSAQGGERLNGVIISGQYKSGRISSKVPPQSDCQD